MIVAVIAGSLAPVPPADLPSGGDKVEHFASYAVLMLWFGSLAGHARRQLVWAVTLACMGVALEYLQRLVPYRDFEVADMIANAAGVGLGWLAARSPAQRLLGRLDSGLSTFRDGGK